MSDSEIEGGSSLPALCEEKRGFVILGQAGDLDSAES
jgi:hypothetical protein